MSPEAEATILWLIRSATAAHEAGNHERADALITLLMVRMRFEKDRLEASGALTLH